MSNADGQRPPTSVAKKMGRLFALLVLLGAIGYVIADYASPNLQHISVGLDDFFAWVEAHPAEGLVAYAAIYACATVFFVPGSLLTLGAGFLFAKTFGTAQGIALGTLTVFCGAYLGLIAAFFIARYMLREIAESWIQKFRVISAVDKAIGDQGLKICILLRLSPVVPFAAFNYVIAVTRISFMHYAIGSLFILPGTVAYVFIGSTVSSIVDTASSTKPEEDQGAMAVRTTLFVGGLVATLVAVAIIGRVSRRILNQALEEAEAEKAAQAQTAVQDMPHGDAGEGADAEVVVEP